MATSDPLSDALSDLGRRIDSAVERLNARMRKAKRGAAWDDNYRGVDARNYDTTDCHRCKNGDLLAHQDRCSCGRYS